MTPNQDPYSDYDPFSKWKGQEDLPEESIGSSDSSEMPKKEDLFSKWQPSTEEISKTEKRKTPFKTEPVSAKEYKDMSILEKIAYSQDLEKEIGYESGKTFSKGLAEGTTLGALEYPEEEGESKFIKGAGKAIGQTPAALGAMALVGLAGAPIAGAFVGSKILQGVFNLGKTFTAFSGLGAAKEGVQAAKGKEVNLANIPIEGGEAVLVELGLKGVMKAAPPVYNWFKGLTKRGQEDLLVRGVIPEEMSELSFKKFKDDVMPLIQDQAKKDLEIATKEAQEALDFEYKQKMSNVKGEYEKGEYERGRLQQEYEAKSAEIASENEAALQQWEQSNKEWDQTVKRQDAVTNALKLVKSQRSGSGNLQGRVTQGGESLGVTSPTLPAPTRIQNEVGTVISPRRISNQTVAGERNVAAVRASDVVDRGNVNNLYVISRDANEGIVGAQENLANELRAGIADIDAMGANPPQAFQELRTKLQNGLNELILFNEEGAAVGFRPVSNQYLLDKAKSLRDSLDYSFQHGDSYNINRPWIDAYQDAVEQTATAMGRTDAVQANQAARQGYREWSDLYNNPYMRQYRNQRTNKPTSIFKNSLNIDNFRTLDQVLSRSPEGAVLSNETRRALVDKELASFYKNPSKVNMTELNEALDNLSPIMSPRERAEIVRAFTRSRSGIRATKVEGGPSAPKEPEFKASPKKPSEAPTSVNIPPKPELTDTPAMKEARKRLKMEAEDLQKLTTTHKGFEKLKKSLGDSTSAKQIYDDIVKTRTRDILYGGRVKAKFKGTDLIDRLNVRKDYELLAELHGEEVMKDLYQAAEQIGKNNVTREDLVKYIKGATTLKFISNTFLL